MRRRGWGLGGVGLGAAVVAGYARLLRPWTHRWGATAAELAHRYPGDELVPEPGYAATLAVTVRARPEEVWPWLMQLGRGRGGLYSYDWLDRLFGILDQDSAQELLPDTRALRPGDAIPIGRDPQGYFPVRAVEPNRALVLGGQDPASGTQWSWALVLAPQGPATRLISRSRVRLPDRLGPRLALAWLDPAAFLMTRKMLLNLRDRAERLARERQAAPLLPAPAG